MAGSLENLLDMAIDSDASDIHIKSNRNSILRVKGNIEKTNIDVSEDGIYEFIYKYIDGTHDKIKEFLNMKRHSLDAAIKYKGRRFRLHMFRGINNVCLTLRLLAEKVPLLEDLNLPESVKSFTQAQSGLILVTGATGSGKTTTIASIIDKINKSKEVAILTIEDPIEYVYTEERAVIEQREVGSHVDSFSQATVDALREDPDIIVVGELRDLETIKNAITLAETGHLVFGTLHTKSVIDTVDRLIDIFPNEQQQQIRVQLSSILFGILHQQMLSVGGTVSVVCELLMNDSVISGMLKNRGSQSSAIKDYMRSKRETGNVHIIDNVTWHIRNNRFKVNDAKHLMTADDYRAVTSRLEVR